MNDNKPSDDRNGNFLDSMWCCKVCDGEIPDGHTDNCDIWKLEKKHKDFIATEYNAVLNDCEQLRSRVSELEAALDWSTRVGGHHIYQTPSHYPDEIKASIARVRGTQSETKDV